MTNVKLKLMFYLLNALLAADIVQARPYSDNATDFVIKNDYNSTHPPIDTHTDPLVVISEAEENERANGHMDAMMTAEQDRDEDLSKKVMDEQKAPDDPDKILKQNSHLDEIMTAEQDRDIELSERSRRNEPKLICEQNTPEDTMKNRKRNIHLDEIITAEQNRDLELSKKSRRTERKVIDEQKALVNSERNNHQIKHLDEIITAEQGRDLELSKKSRGNELKVLHEQKAPKGPEETKIRYTRLDEIIIAELVRDLELSERSRRNQPTVLKRKLNTSDSVLDELIDSKTDREETTLVVIDSKENERANGHMDAMMRAERVRDKDLFKKVIGKQKVPEDPDKNKTQNTHLDEIITAEQDRDLKLSEKSRQNKVTCKQKVPEDLEIDIKQDTHLDEIITAEQDRDVELSEKNRRIQPDEQKVLKALEENKNPNTHLDEIIIAEQDRDIELSERSKRNEPKVFEIPKKYHDAFESQLNISSSALDEFIDSETDREGTLTDVLFRPESEMFVEPPKFEFLIVAKTNLSDVDSKSVSGRSDNIIDEVEKNSSDVLKKVDYVELVEVLKPGNGINNSAYSLLNITANEVDNDLAPDTRFTDLQTLVLACLGTLLPLLGVLFATLCIRSLIRRCCPGCCTKKIEDSDSESSEDKDTNHQQLKSPSEDSPSGEAGDGDSPTTNGSIFTMTLKNNHLIVETEERNDITKNGRETKMKYSPDNDGIFVVEVQQSTAYRPNNKPPVAQHSPTYDPQISTNQALIHRVPEELEKKLEEDSGNSSTRFDKQKALALSSTGLSISDLSLSSAGSHNVSYSYSGQLGYEHGPFGYPIYAGYETKDEYEGITHDNSQEPLITKTPTDPDKPVVTAAIFKQDSLIGNDVLQGPGYCLEGSSDGPLLSDVQAREVSLQKLHDKKLENGIAVQIAEKIESPNKKALNRADSLPVRLEDQKVPDPIINANKAMDIIEENNIKDVEVPNDVLKDKRASLPLIRTEVYDTVKDVIEPTGSLKFEKVVNNTSPGEGSFDQPPMITITEEESAKSDSS